MEPMLDLCLRQSPKPTKLAIIAVNQVYALLVAEGLNNYAKKLGVDVVYYEKFPDDASDVSSMLAIIKSKNPDLLFETGVFEHAALVTRQLKDLKWIPKALSFSVGPQLPEYAATFKKDAEGVMCVGMYHHAIPYKDPVFGSNLEYAELIKKKIGVYPNHIHGNSTGAGLLLQRALKEAGSFDQEKLRDTLSKIEIRDSIIGPIKYDSAGRNIWASTTVLQIQNGENMIVGPENRANAKFMYPLLPWDKR